MAGFMELKLRAGEGRERHTNQGRTNLGRLYSVLWRQVFSQQLLHPPPSIA